MSGIIPAAATIWNALSQARENRLNRDFAREQSDLAWQRSLEQWERETQYNSFSNQMSLLKQAGLNPNLAYDQSTDSASGQSPQMANATGIAPQVDPLVIAQANLANAQADNFRQDTSNKYTEGQIRGQELLNLIAETNARAQFKGKSLDGKDLNYWQYQVEHQSSLMHRDMVMAGLDEERAGFLLDYIQNYGTTEEIEQIKAYQSQRQLNEVQMAALRQDIRASKAMLKGLEVVNGKIDELPEEQQALAYLLLTSSSGRGAGRVAWMRIGGVIKKAIFK